MTLTAATRVERPDPVRRRLVLLTGSLVATVAASAWAVSFPGLPVGWVGLASLGCAASLVLAGVAVTRDRVPPVPVVGAVVLAVALTDDSGLAWLPDGPTPDRADGDGLPPSGFTHLDGPWYRWTCGC
jgi:hypothetical protein